MVRVILRNNESQQQLFSRFRKSVSRSGKMSQLRSKRWFVSKNEQRRLEKKKAIRRIKRRAMKRATRKRGRRY